MGKLFALLLVVCLTACSASSLATPVVFPTSLPETLTPPTAPLVPTQPTSAARKDKLTLVEFFGVT